MSSIERKIKRQQKKTSQKKAKKGLQDAINATAGIPSKCTQCDLGFNMIADASTWIVDMTPKMIQLLCPKCAVKTLKVNT